MSIPILQLKNIKLNKNGKQVLKVDQFTVEEGAIIGIVGPNGAGKSTFMKVMAFLEEPDEGEIFFRGINVSNQIGIDQRRQIAMVFQQPLMLNTTVHNNVAISLKLRNRPKKEIQELVIHWLERFGILHLQNRNAKTLSGGEAQRVALARAMISEPKLLFLDEPFTALDLPTRKRLLEDFRQVLMETKTTTLFVSHDFQEVKFLCKEMAMLYKGHLIDRAKFDEINRLQLPEELAQFLQDWMTPLAI